MSEFAICKKHNYAEPCKVCDGLYQLGRSDMKADILKLFSADLLCRDASLQKIAKAIEEIE